MAAGAVGSAPPLTTQVSDTQVLLNGVPIPIFYTSYGQINCQIPTDAAVGTSLLQVKRTDGQASNTVSVDHRGAGAAAAAHRGGRLRRDRERADGSLPLPSRRHPGIQYASGEARATR